MQKYQVVEQCYVPVGTGHKFKKPGQVVHLDATDAASLKGFVVPLVEGVQELNTRPKPRKSKAKKPEGPSIHIDQLIVTGGEGGAGAAGETPVEEPEEVTPDASEPAPADERTAGEDRG